MALPRQPPVPAAVPSAPGEPAATVDEGAREALTDKSTGVTSLDDKAPDVKKVAFYQDVFRELLFDFERMVHREVERERQNDANQSESLQSPPPSPKLIAPAQRLSEHSEPSERNIPIPANRNSRRTSVRKSALGDFVGKELLDDSSSDGALKIFCSRILQHRHFEKLVGIIIATNVIFIGVSADYAIRHIENPSIGGSIAVELTFCIVYILELLLRLVVFRWDFFTNEDRAWNLFDSGLVLQSVYEQVEHFFPVGQGSAGNLSFLRILRLVKAVKVMRVIRMMRSMAELRLIITSILGSLRSMFWSLVLLLVVLGMFSMLFVQSVAGVLSDDTKLSDRDVDKLLFHWGGVIRGMRTLFAACTGGIDWLDVANPLIQIGWVFFVIFCFYIAFFIFVILNTITALFVETTISSSMKDHQSCIQREMEKKQEYIDKLQLLFDNMDIDGDGLISMHEFQSRMNDQRMKAFAASLGIEIGDTRHFFAMLTDQGHTGVDLDSFVSGCIRMKGPATSVDLQEMRHTMRKLLDMMDEHAQSLRLLQSR